MSKRPLILLMDEDADTLEQLQTTLQREGYRVAVAVDGHAGFQLAQRTKPDLIVSELLLAGVNGYEVWQTLRREYREEPIPILVISALNIPSPGEPWRPNTNAEWQQLPYDTLLSKPVDLRRFLRVVKNLLEPDQSETISSGPSVVVALEDQEIQNSLVGMLQSHDFEVETYPSLADCSNKLRRMVPPAVLILDYRRPNKTVRNIITHITKTAPDTAIILFIAPTEEVEATLAPPCHGVLTTPLNPVQTITTIKQTLNLCNMRRRIAVLSHKLITANRDLLDAQQVLQAQNEELQLVNAQLIELDNLKETLTGMVVHDLKTPLAAVLGALSFLSKDPELNLPSAIQNLITGAMAAANQMVRLTETLLEGQRLENRRLEPDREPFDLPTIVEVSLQQISPLLKLHRLQADALIPDQLPLIYADPHLSRRILENLLDNAIKFSPPNSTITITAVAEQNFIKVSVKDQGPGIPKDQQTEIFKQFAQIKNAANPSSRGGFGLGLTFCHLATEAMNGSIWVESDGESGTNFNFTLPIYREPQAIP